MTRRRVGRRNVYEVQPARLMRHRLARHRQVGAFLELMLDGLDLDDLEAITDVAFSGNARSEESTLARMPVSAPRDSTIAVVGDGFGSLIVYATAVYLGFRPQEITIFGPSDNPVKTYQQFAFNLGPDGAAVGVRVALPAGRLAHVRGARGLVAAEPQPADPLRAAAVQPRRPGHPRRGERRRAAARLERQPLRHEGRLAPARRFRKRRLAAFRPLRRGRAVHRPREARHARLRPRPACPIRPCSRRRGRIPPSPTGSSRPTRRRRTTRTGATS